jgi:GTPase SAR1 family protein
MAAIVEPAKKSYFFGKGYTDLGDTIKGAWQRNFTSIGKYKDKIGESRANGDSGAIVVIKFVCNVFAMLAILICGSIITAIVSVFHIVILLLFMLIVYIGFSVIWLTDRIYLQTHKIFTACNECKEKSLIPTYICPKCGAQHRNLTPGVYGILHRTCNCGEKLPTTFFNGRRNLAAICPHCGTPLSDRETVPICIPIVGGRSVGKTAFITAFSKEFFDEVAPTHSWDLEFYNDKKKQIYGEIETDFTHGSTRMTKRPSDINEASSVSFSFFVKGKEFKPERLVHVYDIAGEVFTDNNENEIQKQYEYCQGIAMIIDPFAIPSVRNRLEDQLTPEDIAGIGVADIDEIIDSFLNKLREVTGLNDKKMSSVPLAVIISKIDSANLQNEIGDMAVRRTMSAQPQVFNDYFNTEDYLCREFLRNNGMTSFLNNINSRFSNNRFFSCSAIGHTRDHGRYVPSGVLPPMQWLFDNADSSMRKSWNDIQFPNKVLEIKQAV